MLIGLESRCDGVPADPTPSRSRRTFDLPQGGQVGAGTAPPPRERDMLPPSKRPDRRRVSFRMKQKNWPFSLRRSASVPAVAVRRRRREDEGYDGHLVGTKARRSGSRRHFGDLERAVKTFCRTRLHGSVPGRRAGTLARTKLVGTVQVDKDGDFKARDDDGRTILKIKGHIGRDEATSTLRYSGTVKADDDRELDCDSGKLDWIGARGRGLSARAGRPRHPCGARARPWAGLDVDSTVTGDTGPRLHHDHPVGRPSASSVHTSPPRSPARCVPVLMADPRVGTSLGGSSVVSERSCGRCAPARPGSKGGASPSPVRHRGLGGRRRLRAGSCGPPAAAPLQVGDQRRAELGIVGEPGVVRRQAEGEANRCRASGVISRSRWWPTIDS